MAITVSSNGVVKPRSSERREMNASDTGTVIQLSPTEMELYEAGKQAGIREERANWVTLGNKLLEEYSQAPSFWLELVNRIILGKPNLRTGG